MGPHLVDNYKEILRSYIEENRRGLQEAYNVPGVLFYAVERLPNLTMKDLYELLMTVCPRHQLHILSLIEYVLNPLSPPPPYAVGKQ